MIRDPLLKEGIQAVFEGDFKRAAKLLTEYTQKEPEDAAGWIWLGFCLEDRAQSTYCMRRAMELDPGNEEAKELMDVIPIITSSCECVLNVG